MNHIGLSPREKPRRTDSGPELSLCNSFASPLPNGWTARHALRPVPPFPDIPGVSTTFQHNRHEVISGRAQFVRPGEGFAGGGRAADNAEGRGGR